jgi:hypothetical protein
VKDYAIKVGSMLFTLVEPHKGHEVEYNRWYERDHFYAGCMIGAWQFAGRRFVATRDLKALRYPGDSPITPAKDSGSYVAIYWVLEDHHDDWNKWAVKQVRQLHADGRMFGERDHIHTLLYDYAWEYGEPDGVGSALALDHPYDGVVAVMGEAEESVGRDGAAEWFRSEVLPDMVKNTSVDQVIAWNPLPLLMDAPGDVPRSEESNTRFLHLYFLKDAPDAGWEQTFAPLGERMEKAGIGKVIWASPFKPTIVGTDTYTDELW